MSILGSINIIDQLVDMADASGKYKIITNFGANNDVDTATAEDIWNGGGLLAYLSAAETMTVVSSSANDASAGTGMRTLTIEGLDGDYNEVSETFILNGTSTVTGTQKFIRVNRSYGLSGGSLQTNAGTISIYGSGTGSGSKQGVIITDDGQALKSHYTVPNGYTAYMVFGYGSIAPTPGSTGNKEGIIRLYIRLYNSSIWRVQATAAFNTGGTGTSGNLVSGYPIPVLQKTDIRIEGYAETNNTQMYGQYTLILKKN